MKIYHTFDIVSWNEVLDTFPTLDQARKYKSPFQAENINRWIRERYSFTIMGWDFRITKERI